MDRLAIFVFLWASQALVHQEFFERWVLLEQWGQIAIIAFGIVVLALPRSLPLFAGLLLSTVSATVVYRLPFVSNHMWLESVIACLLLGEMLRYAVARTSLQPRGRSGWRHAWSPEEREAFVDRITPVLTTLLLAVYFFATLHKLNGSFLDPEVSCAVEFYFEDAIPRFPFLPATAWIANLVIWGTLLMEGGVFLLLCLRSTRPLGILAGLAMHLVFGIVGHHTFSSFTVPLYVLFFSGEAADRIAAWWAAVGERIGLARRQRMLVVVRAVTVAGLTALTAYGIAILVADGHAAYLDGVNTGKWIWLSWHLCFAGIAAGVLWRVYRSGGQLAPIRLSGSPVWMWGGALLVVINGFMPYLGLKTHPTFSMYSNLRVEGGRSNHLFIPDLTGHWSPTRTLVEVLEANHPRFEAYVQRDLYMTRFELRRRIHAIEQDFFIVYRQAGRIHRVARVGGRLIGEHVPPPLHPLLGKLVAFRPVTKASAMECFH